MFRRALTGSLLIVACFFTTDLHAQTANVSPAGKQGVTKCWESTAAILPAAGIAADDTHGYFAVSAGKVIALDLESGEIAWTSEVGGNVRSDITVSDGVVFIVAFADDGESAAVRSPVLRALSAKTGLPNWSLELPNASRYFIEPTVDGLLAVSSDGTMFRLGRGDGRITWKSAASGPIAIPPRVNEDRVFVATTKRMVEEFELGNGRKVASVATEATPAFVGAGDDSTAVYSDPKGLVYSIKTSGTKNWKFRAGGKIVVVKPVNDNVLLGSVDNFVYFMSVDYGNLLWKRRLPGRIANGALVRDNLAIFTVIGDSSAYLIELEKGRLVDQITLSGDDAFLLTPIRANGTYLLAATQNGMSAFSSSCGNEKSGK